MSTIAPNRQESYDNLLEYLVLNQWKPKRIGQKLACGVTYSGKHGALNGYAEMREDEIFLFFLMAPFTVPASAQPAITEFITRANYGLHIGCLLLNPDNGELLYKSSIEFRGEILPLEMIRDTIVATAVMIDHLLPALQQVMEGKRSPADALASLRSQG